MVGRKGRRTAFCLVANDVPEGCVVPKNVAKWEGERLVFIEEREEAGRKVRDGEIFSDIDPTSFMQILQEGEAGKGLKTTVTIHATKVNAIDVLHQSTSQASDATKIASMANQILAQQIDPALQGFWTLNGCAQLVLRSAKISFSGLAWDAHLGVLRERALRREKDGVCARGTELWKMRSGRQYSKRKSSRSR